MAKIFAVRIYLQKPTRYACEYRDRPSRCWRVCEWLAASLEMMCPVRGCGFESRALRLSGLRHRAKEAPKSDFCLDLRRFFLRYLKQIFPYWSL